VRAPGGPDNSLVRAAQQQEASPFHRPLAIGPLLSDAGLFDTPPTASRPGQQVVRATLDHTTSPVPVFPLARPLRMGEGWGEGAFPVPSRSCPVPRHVSRPTADTIPPEWSEDLGLWTQMNVSRPAPLAGAAPTRPKSARRCRGSFPPIEKKDPHHRRGSKFRSRRGSFPHQGRCPSPPCVPSRFRWPNPVRRVERYRLDALRAVWSTKGGAPSSSLPRPVKVAEPEFLRPCKQLGKYFGSGLHRRQQR
jgi:hypothetical protein